MGLPLLLRSYNEEKMSKRERRELEELKQTRR